MPDLTITRDRAFPITDLTAATTIVAPDHLADSAAVRSLQRTIAEVGGRKPEILPQHEFDEGLFARTQVIACGHMANNAALRRLYVARRCFVDTFFPGPGGFFVKSVSDPFSHGRNCLVAGASTDIDLEPAVQALEKAILDGDGKPRRVHAHRFDHPLPEPPDESALARLIQERLDSWKAGWMASPFRENELRNYMWYYYLTDHPNWGRLVAPVFAGSIDLWREDRLLRPESYHCLFNLHSSVHLWDLIEDSPLISAEERHQVATMLAELMEHQQGIFYMTEKVNPAGMARQNHSTFIAMNLAVCHDYLSSRYGIGQFAPGAAMAESIFAGQADSYKPDDDAGVGYAWLVPQSTLNYLLFRNDYRYVDDGPVDDLCTMAVLTTDNMRSEVGYGDSSGYAGFSRDGWASRLWPLLVSTWRTADPEHLWALNWLGEGKAPQLANVMLGLYAAVELEGDGYRLAGCEPREPRGLFGICHLPLPEAVLRRVHHLAPPAHRPDSRRRYYDKLSLRRSFDPHDEYLLLEGCGTLSHGHEDANAILRVTWRERAWLADGDYIRAAPKFHNSVVVCRDGVGVLDACGDGLTMPPLAILNRDEDGDEFSLVQTEVAGYNGMDWQRNLFWAKGRYFAVIDRLRCTTAGDYDCRCLWRLLGEATRQGPLTALEQEGVRFFVHNGDGAQQELVVDDHAAGFWTSYPHADPAPKVLHQRRRQKLRAGEDLIYMNLLTPQEGTRVERISAQVLRVLDGEEPALLGVGSAPLGELTIGGPLWTVSQCADGIRLQGVEMLRCNGRQEACDGRPLLIEPDHELVPALVAALELPVEVETPTARLESEWFPAAGGPDDRSSDGPSPPTGDRVTLEPDWSRTSEADINALFLQGNQLLAATAAGRLELLDATRGAPVWQQTLDVPATAVRLATLAADGGCDAIAGTADSRLLVLAGADGAECWQRPLRNMHGRGERVTALDVADLDGDGALSVLAANAGWYVNAFAADGQPLWAQWFRYHVITAMIAADADADGRAEVMVGNIYSTPLTVHNGDGSFRWSTFEEVGSEGNATTPRRGICNSRMALCDADEEGIRHIAYGTTDGWVFVVEPRRGEETWHAHVVGEVTGLVPLPDGLIIASEYGDVYRFSDRGELRWRRGTGCWIRQAVRVDDWLVVACEDGRLRWFDLEGGTAGTGQAGADIIGLQAHGSGLICNLKGGQLRRFELAPAGAL